MAEYRAFDSEPEAKVFQLLDHLLDQWLILADTFKSADPILANAALKVLDERIDAFTREIDPVGWDHDWYETGRRLFRRALIQRLNDLPLDRAPISGFSPQD